MVACRFRDGSKVKNVLTFPVISSSDINPNWGFKPALYVEGNSYFLSNKEKAMQMYKTEYATMSRHRGEGIAIWAKFFGLQVNAPYAEPFKVVRCKADFL
jgi:hypothetical protein